MMESNINGSKLMFHPERVAGDHRPITADVFLNNYCNNNCPYCVYHRWELDKGAYAMTRDEFVRYATRLKELGVLGFILTGGGEPMITPDFEAIAAWLEENHLHYGGISAGHIPAQHIPDHEYEQYARTHDGGCVEVERDAVKLVQPRLSLSLSVSSSAEQED